MPEKQTCEPEAPATPEQEKLVQDVAAWLSTHEIAKAIVKGMVEARAVVDLESAKKVWESFLKDNLTDVLQDCAQDLVDNDALKEVAEGEEPTPAGGKPASRF